MIIPLNNNKATKDRYFNFSLSTQAQDSEAKIIEYVMEYLRKERGINRVNNASSASLVDDILINSSVQIKLTSEMKPCKSCTFIIENFDKKILIK